MDCVTEFALRNLRASQMKVRSTMNSSPEDATSVSSRGRSATASASACLSVCLSVSLSVWLNQPIGCGLAQLLGNLSTLRSRERASHWKEVRVCGNLCKQHTLPTEDLARVSSFTSPKRASMISGASSLLIQHNSDYFSATITSDCSLYCSTPIG